MRSCNHTLELGSLHMHGICEALGGEWQIFSANPGRHQDSLHCVDVKIVVVHIAGQLEHKLKAHKIACCSVHSVQACMAQLPDHSQGDNSGAKFSSCSAELPELPELSEQSM